MIEEHDGPVWGAWHGGANYNPTPWDEAERFESLEACWEEFDRRPSDPFYPAVPKDTPDNGGPTMVIFFYDPSGVRDPYPDRLLRFSDYGVSLINYA